VVVRVITAKPADELTEFFKNKKFRFTSLTGESADGAVNVLFTVIKRERLQETINAIKTHNPNAMYTVEGVKAVKDGEIADDRSFSRRIFRTGVRH